MCRLEAARSLERGSLEKWRPPTWAPSVQRSDTLRLKRQLLQGSRLRPPPPRPSRTSAPHPARDLCRGARPARCAGVSCIAGAAHSLQAPADPTTCANLMGCDDPMACAGPMTCAEFMTCANPVTCADLMICADPVACDDPTTCATPMTCADVMTCAGPMTCDDPMTCAARRPAPT